MMPTVVCYQSEGGGFSFTGSQAQFQVVGAIPDVIPRTLPSPRHTCITEAANPCGARLSAASGGGRNCGKLEKPSPGRLQLRLVNPVLHLWNRNRNIVPTADF